MATKGVLGNDPFQRGAAQRPAEEKPAAPTSAQEKKARPARKAAEKRAPEKRAAEKKAAAKAPKAEKSPKARKPARAQARVEEEPLPLREPAAPVTPRESPPPRAPVISEDDSRPLTPQEREVDQVLITTAAIEAAEAAAEDALNDVLANDGSSSEMLEEMLGMEERATLLEEQAPPHTAVSEVAPGVELPDAARDEFPPGRQGSLSLVPPAAEQETRGEHLATEPAQVEHGSAGSRVAGMLSLAREIAVQVLASNTLAQSLIAAQGLVGAVRAGLGTGGSTSLDEYGRDAELVEGLQPVLDFLYDRYWRVSVQGADLLPAGAAILVANHSGALPYDGLVANLAIRRERPDVREPRWLVEDQVFHAPMLGTLFNRLGAVRACPENALRLLDEQRPVLVFPEGYQGLSKPFAQRYQLKRFGRGGFVKLALRTGAPIVPVAIVGSEETSPLLGRIPASALGVPYLPLMPLGPIPLPAKWTLRFGEPIGMEGVPPDAADDLAEVQRLTERTRESIQGMLQALLKERRSVFAG